jgi:cellulose synthase (UDP-forming)
MVSRPISIRKLAGLIYLAFALLALYSATRIGVLLASTGYNLADSVMAVLLILAELFLVVHGVGYFGSMMKADRMRRESAPPLLAPPTNAPVALVIAAYNESPDVLDETLSAVVALDYPALHVYLLDDSTRDECRHGAETLAHKYGITLVQRQTRAGFKAGAINDVLPTLTEKYIALLDADQRPISSWLKDLVPVLEQDSELAFVQVPQVYGNLEGLPVARAAAYQQAIFFEYICEGKSRSNAMFCCGSNVIFRVDALRSLAKQVGDRTHYFDETSVTEDFATSALLHMKGWRSRYINLPYVRGLGPETLPAYFTQQMRWATGTLGIGLRLLRHLIRAPRALQPAQWWEYLLSGTYYFVGWANCVFVAAPIAFIAFGIKPLQGYTHLYLTAFIPYIVLTMNLVFYGMRLRGYKSSGIWLASALTFATAFTYMKASLVALAGRRRVFGVTAKGVGGSIPLRHMLPELCFFAGSLAAAIAGVAQMVLAGPSLPYALNTFWASYHALTLSVLFLYLNRRVTIPAREPVFAVAA